MHRSIQFKQNAYRRGAAIIAALLSFNTLMGCGILGDGDVTIVTAPPIVQKQVVTINNYKGEKTRFDVAGEDAFYLLPGIENYPDYLQDFSCLDYTKDGWFIYYYCGPSYISKEEIAKYKGTTGKAPKENRYPDIDRNGTALCDAYVFMMYNPVTLEYKVIDAKGFEHITTSKADTGMEFYKSEEYGFYTLSHAYGCKIFGKDQYFILDQNGKANVYDSTGKNLSSITVGNSISLKTQEVASNLGVQNGAGATESDSAIKSDSDSDKKEMEDAIEEIQKATNKTYDTGKKDGKEDIKLNCLIKSAVMDGNDRMYLSVMMYTGESPWISDVMYNRVISIYDVDISGSLMNFISTNEHAGYQEYLYGKYGVLEDFDLGKLKNGDYINIFATDGISSRPGGLNIYDIYDMYGRYDVTWWRGARNVHFDALYYDVSSEDKFYGFKSDNPGFNAFIFARREREYASEITEISNDANNAFTKYDTYFGQNLADAIVWSADACRYGRYRWEPYAVTISEYNRLPNMVNYDATTRRNSFINPISTKNNKDSNQELLLAYTPTVDIGSMGETEGLKRARKIRFGVVDLPTATGEDTPLGTIYAEPYEYNEKPYYAYKYVKDEYWEDLCQKANVEEGKSLREKSLAYQYLISVADKLEDAYDSMDENTRQRLTNVFSATLHGVFSGRNVKQLVESYLTNIDYRSSTGSGSAFYELVVYYDEYLEEKFEQEYGYNHIPMKVYNPNEFYESYGDKLIDTESVLAALKGYTRVVDESKTIPANTIPVSYRMVFPEGTTVQFVDMTEAEGSSTSSVRDGALLFADSATLNKDGTLRYKASMRHATESGIDDVGYLADGAAIDTGTFQISSVISKGQDKTEYYTDAWMLITDEKVSFFYDTNSNSKVLNSMTIANEDLLSSTGFTIHTENEASHATLKRDDIDNEGENKLTEEKLSQYLNSTRVGTIQSASSFTPLNENEVLISAYDTGATILNLHDLDGTYSVLPIRSGSYYQSFPTTQDGKYVIVGFDTEDYMYGSLDLARAKVYVLDYKTSRDKMYEGALETYLDQLAVDYVRRQYRTRENEDGVVEVLKYEDDTSTEAVLEQKLFADDITDETAIGTLKKEVEEPRRVEHTETMGKYLLTLRKRVSDQKDAMKEVLTLTGADKLGAATLNKPYWVNLMSRIQNAADLGNLKDMLCEIVMHEDMKEILEEVDKERYERLEKSLLSDKKTATDEEKAEVSRLINEMKEKDRKTYDEIRKVLNYKKEHEDMLNSLSENNVNSKSNTQDKTDKSEINSLADRTYDGNLEVYEEENMDKTMTRMEAQALVLEDIEEMYFYKHPLEPEYYYGPEGKDSANPAISVEKEDAAWEEYLADLLERISPDNLAIARNRQIEDMAALCYAGSEGLSDDVKESMRKSVIAGLDNVQSVRDVEELLFGERMKLPAFLKYKAEFDKYKNTAWEDDQARIASVSKSLWYLEMKKELLGTEPVKNELASRGCTWEEYLQAVVMSYTGRQLRDDITGEQVNVNSDIGAVRYFDKLLDFICIGAGELSEATRKEMLEELLRGMQTVSDARGAEEAVIVMRTMLPEYSGYLGEYEKYKAAEYSSAAEQTEAYHNAKFYKDLIVKLKESDEMKAYLKEAEITWDAYMASLIAMAPDAGDPEAAVRQYYNLETEPE